MKKKIQFLLLLVSLLLLTMSVLVFARSHDDYDHDISAAVGQPDNGHATVSYSGHIHRFAMTPPVTWWRVTHDGLQIDSGSVSTGDILSFSGSFILVQTPQGHNGEVCVRSGNSFSPGYVVECIAIAVPPSLSSMPES